MARYKSTHKGLKLLAVDFDRQAIPGSFEHALCHLVDHELNLFSFYMRYKNDDKGASDQQEVRWHIAPMLARLQLTKAEETTVVNLLPGYTNNRNSIVKTMSMHALADIALRSHRLLPDIRQHIEEISVVDTPAMKARGKKFLTSLAIESHGERL